MKYRKTLFWHFFLALLLILTAGALSLGWLFRLKAEQVLDQHLSSQLKESMIPASQMFSPQLLNLLHPGQEQTKLYRHLKRKAIQLSLLLGANSIVIVNRKLQVVVTTHSNPIGSEYSLAKEYSNILNKAWQGEITDSPIYRLKNKVIKTGYTPIIDNKEQISYILCVEIGASRQKVLHQLNQITIYFSVTGIVIASMISLLLWSSLAYPLNKLAKAMETLSKNAYPEKIITKRKDEIGFLIDRFNFMVDSLHKQEIELKKVHQKELKRKEHLALLGEFSAGIAHEIRNPLAAMKGFAELLKRKKYNSEELTDGLIAEIDSLNGTVGQILSYARDDLYQPQLVPVFSLLSEVLLQALAEAKDIEVKLDLDPQIPTLFADPKEFKKALVNLLKNAAIAMAGSKEKILTIRTFKDPENIVVSIVDTGRGIPDELWKNGKIFQPFFTTREEGTGLGLPIVAKIIERHQGQLLLESKEGIGTTVKILFPLEGQDNANFSS